MLLLLACTSTDSVPRDSAAPPGDSVEQLPGESDSVPSELEFSIDSEIQTLVTVSWDQPAAGSPTVEWSVEGDDWHAAPTIPREAGPQSQLLLGIPYATTADVRVSTGDTTLTGSVTTGDLPDGLPIPAVLVSEPDAWEPTGTYLLGSINQDQGGWDQGRYWMFLVDRAGRIVWARRGEGQDFTIYLRVSKDNDILWDVSTWWSKFDEGATSQIHRMKIDGVVTETYDAPGMHHAFTELPDGSIVWGAGGANSEKLQRRHPDGSVDTIWDCQPFYDRLGLKDWCHTNSIVYVEERDTMLLSFPTDQTFVTEVDVATGTEKYWFGHIPGSWAFDPEDSAFYYQHGVTFTDAGTLLVSTKQNDHTNNGMVREYSLDEENTTLHEVWSYGESDTIPQQYAGEAHRLTNGNTLHNFGTTPRVQEITPEGTLAWDLAFDGNRLIGRTTFVEDIYALAP